MVNLEIAKIHMRIEFEDEDVFIQSLIMTATEYVSELTGIQNNSEAPRRYNLVVMLLVSHWYSNREAAVVGSINKLPYGVEMLIQSIRQGKELI